MHFSPKDIVNSICFPPLCKDHSPGDFQFCDVLKRRVFPERTVFLAFHCIPVPLNEGYVDSPLTTAKCYEL